MKRTKTGRMSKRIIALSAAAFCMITAVSVKEATAYFTTYVSAGGSHVVELGSKTDIEDEVSNKTKHISIKNISENDCFVRVKVFFADWLKPYISYHDTSESGKLWTYSEKDGYWYYGPILPAGASTEIFDVKIEVPGSNDIDKDSFNVIVVQECAPVVYDEAGKPDWSTFYTDYTQETQGKGADQ